MDRTVKQLFFWFIGLVTIIAFILYGIWSVYMGVMDSIYREINFWSLMSVVVGVFYLGLATLVVYLFLDIEGYI